MEQINIYFAPMEGITGYVFRQAHHEYFKGISKYFTPFIVPNQKNKFRTRERNDVLPEHNQGIPVVPQIMTNDSGQFLQAAAQLYDMGYREVNLNLGCPSATVVTKKRGSGFLAVPSELERFFEEVFEKLPEDMKFSVKTRLGKESPEKFPELLEIYNRYPLSELIIHPRVQKDFYNGEPRMEWFSYAVEHSRHALCYNGNIFSQEDFSTIVEKYPSVHSCMIGRGLLARPDLAQVLFGMGQSDDAAIKQFHDRIYEGYKEALKNSGTHTVFFRMKELWFYMLPLFVNCELHTKQMKKVKTEGEYESVTQQIFRDGLIRAKR